MFERAPAERKVAGRWMAACLLGEAFGIAVVATIYAAIDRGLLAPAAPWILTAGAWEGLCLGGAQALVLKALGIRPLPWVALTVFAAAGGYGLSLLGGAGVDSAGGGIEPGLILLLGLGLAMGVVMGALMGAIQWAGARRKLGLFRWIGGNALGWAAAMAVIMVAATSVQGSWPLYCIALSGAVAGAIAGLLVGAATLWALPKPNALSDV